MSPSSSADQRIRERGLKMYFDISQVEGVDGTTQDMVSFIAEGGNVFLVALDFADSTTNVKDLKKFLLAIPNIKDIIIDHLPQRHLVEIFSREQLLDDQEINFL
ncbi:hypothetical protein INT45_005615 [Circinella minor]|uniref:Uncharacterized protein n=1 Tax=Circinella minor TaxID=1195481 RepID=A0A8H7SA02_9FUNG|nr:hypothetical protein INT45_005615 [Circinella minor]